MSEELARLLREAPWSREAGDALQAFAESVSQMSATDTAGSALVAAVETTGIVPVLCEYARAAHARGDDWLLGLYLALSALSSTAKIGSAAAVLDGGGVDLMLDMLASPDARARAYAAVGVECVVRVDVRARDHVAESGLDILEALACSVGPNDSDDNMLLVISDCVSSALATVRGDDDDLERRADAAAARVVALATAHAETQAATRVQAAARGAAVRLDRLPSVAKLERAIRRCARQLAPACARAVRRGAVTALAGLLGAPLSDEEARGALDACADAAVCAAAVVFAAEAIPTGDGADVALVAGVLACVGALRPAGGRLVVDAGALPILAWLATSEAAGLRHSGLGSMAAVLSDRCCLSDEALAAAQASLELEARLWALGTRAPPDARAGLRSERLRVDGGPDGLWAGRWSADSRADATRALALAALDALVDTDAYVRAHAARLISNVALGRAARRRTAEARAAAREARVAAAEAAAAAERVRAEAAAAAATAAEHARAEEAASAAAAAERTRVEAAAAAAELARAEEVAAAAALAKAEAAYAAVERARAEEAAAAAALAKTETAAAHTAAVRVQAVARGHAARLHASELSRGQELLAGSGAVALATADAAAEARLLVERAEKRLALASQEDDDAAADDASEAAGSSAAADEGDAALSQAVEMTPTRAPEAATNVQAVARGRHVREDGSGASPASAARKPQPTETSAPPARTHAAAPASTAAPTASTVVPASEHDVRRSDQPLAHARAGAQPKPSRTPSASSASRDASRLATPDDGTQAGSSRAAAVSAELPPSRRSPTSGAQSPRLPPIARWLDGSPEPAQEWATSFASGLKAERSSGSWLSAEPLPGRTSPLAFSGEPQWGLCRWQRGALEAEPFGGAMSSPPQSRPSQLQQRQQLTRPSTVATESRLTTRSRLEGAATRALPISLVEATVHNRERGRLLSDMGLLTSASSSLRARRADAPATRATSPPLGLQRRVDLAWPRARQAPGGGDSILQHALMGGPGDHATTSANLKLPQLPPGRNTSATRVHHGRVW